ncbi:hypothetical protein MHBO_002879, partial [Bonamia ostreae]
MTPSKKHTLIILMNGGTASGKTTVCEQIVRGLEKLSVRIISLDNYYRTPSKEEMENISKYNFDHPDSFDWKLMKENLESIKKRETTQIPLYDFRTHSRLEETETLAPVDVLIIEGILACYDKDVRDLADMIVFVDTDSDLRLMRR